MLLKLYHFVLTLCFCITGNAAQLAQLFKREPCRVSDLACIQKYFADNSQCDPMIFNLVPPQTSPVFFQVETSLNVTFVDSQGILENLDRCKFSKFFTNTKTKKTVITIDCRNIRYQAERTIVEHIPKKENLYYHFGVEARFDLVRMTMNLPSNNLNICAHRAYAYVSSGKFRYSPRDDATRNKIDEIERADRDGLHKKIATLEIWNARTTFLFRIFINSMVCNFGCDPALGFTNYYL